jgi:hypothetical protein
MNPDNIKGFLISETVTTSTTNVLSDKSGEPTVFETVLQEGDIPNRNKRIYPTDVIKNGIATEYVQERLRTHSWVGEAGHPLAPTVERQLYIDQSNISHIIEEVWWEANILKGRVQTALTSRGKDMQGLIRQKMEVAFSMRGYGPISEKQGDITVIKDPLHILCYDWIIHPSHKPAYMTKILSEGAINISGNGNDYFIPLDESAILFLNEESKNIKSLKDQYNFQKGRTIGRDKKRNLIYIEDHNDILAVKLEDAIAYEIDNYLSQI